VNTSPDVEDKLAYVAVYIYSATPGLTQSAYGFADVATLNGVINLDETTLYNNGQISAS
jgi:hypothetical protein